MSKNKLIILIGIVLIILITMIVFCNTNNQEKTEGNFTMNSEISYDEETALYYIRDEETGEIIQASSDEAELEFYKEHPDYNPNPLATRSTDIKDFVINEQL